MAMSTTYPKALSVAGSDSGGGAGIQADLKTFSALGCYGMTVITAVTAQNTCGVTGVFPLPAEATRAQLDAVMEDIGADAVKLGMLHDAATIDTVADGLARWGARNVVLDPVMVSKSGHRLLQQHAVRTIRERLFPLATLVTPNLPEAGDLIGRTVRTRDDMELAASALLGFGSHAVLVKGGHIEDSHECPDLLAWRDGARVAIRWFTGTRIGTANTHGTGCTLSAAIAAHLARGFGLEDAVARGRDYLRCALAAGASMKLGAGQGPVHHFYGQWPHTIRRDEEAPV
jgi:hydroxymethylpyrimidine/phosphomethylpyrimidine kinase